MAEKDFLVFKAYARFLLEEKLPEITQENLRIIRELQLPLLQLFAHLPEDELLALIRQSLAAFLQQIAHDQAWEAATADIAKWRENQLPGIDREQVKAADIILSYSARKQLFITFLPAYTQNARLITDILLELEHFYLRLEQEALQVYAQIQEQELRIANHKLKESQEELQAANEEMQAANEELQVLNEEMEATNEELHDQIIRREVVEENLKERERKFRLLAENATDVIFTLNSAGTVTYVSPSCLQTLGYRPHQLIGQSVYPFLHPEDASQLCIQHRLMVDHDLHDVVDTYRFWQKGGTYLWLESTARILRDHGPHQEVEILVAARNVDARRRAEQQLAEERQFLSTILENISDGVVACDSQGELSYFNRATLKFHGLPAEQIPAEAWAEHYSLCRPDGSPLPMTEVPLYRALQGEQVVRQEMMITPKEGSKRLLLSTGNQFLGPTGEVLGAVVTMHDVTEQKESERELLRLNQELTHSIAEALHAKEQLRQLNEQLEQKVQDRTSELAYQKEWLLTLFMQVPALIAILTGPEGMVELSNEAFTNLWGRRDVLGKPMRLAWPELPEKDFFTLVSQVYQTGQPVFAREYMLQVDRHNDGHLHRAYFNFIFAPYNNPNGQTEGVILYGVDVTEQVEARHLVERSEESLRLALEAGKMGTWQMDLVSDRSTRSLQHDQIFGYDKMLLAWDQKIFLSHVVPESREQVQAHFERATTTGELAFQARIARADQQQAWIAVQGQVFFGEDPAGTPPKPLRMAGVVLDITGPKQAEEALQRSHADMKNKNQELEKINADLDNFIYIISHDLKTPVVNLEGLVLELRHELDGKAEKETLSLLGMVEASTARFKKTLENLSQIIRYQQEPLPVAECLSLREALGEVQALLAPAIKEASVALEEQITADTVWFDQRSLLSIFQNLLSNALKYRSPDRPAQIRVRTTRLPGFTVLEVWDNGLGLGPEQQAKVFELFRRFHRHVDGSGMGLYIVKKIMDRHQGSVAVESEKGEYTSFKLYFKDKPTAS